MPWFMFQLFLRLAAITAQSELSHESFNSEPHLVSLGKIEPQVAQTSGFDISALDRNVDPCIDFYQYACGTWRARNPIPAGHSHWGRFDELRERNLETLRDILDQASIDDPNRSAIEQKIGDYYAACMDEQGIVQKGIEPIELELDRIAAMQDKSGMANEVARLHAMGADVLFRFGSGQDLKNSRVVIAQADQGGLGLPDRAFYFTNDSGEMREKYLEHVGRMFVLIGEPPEKAAIKAQAVMKIETALAAGSLDIGWRRDPVSLYHKTPLQELVTSICPSFAWRKYLFESKAPHIETLNLVVPAFFAGLDNLIKNSDLEDWKAYLTWHLVNSQAALLNSAIANENFNFYGKTLTGAQELRPRWQHCVSLVDFDLGEALGQKYVERTLAQKDKDAALRMSRNIERAFEKDIVELSWMNPQTKREAITKLHAVANKIGYPGRWRDYSKLKIIRGDGLGNSQRASQFEFRRQLAKIGKPVDRDEWSTPAPMVNAYYSAQLNSVNCPAGILQPPFFDRNMDDAVNFGAIGMVIAHELAHGFDDEGRQFGPKGNLHDWWLEQDNEQFKERAECLTTEYSGFTAVHDLKENGKLTLGENIADNVGVRLAYMAMLDSAAGKGKPKTDGFTPEQRLFLGFAQIWCENVTDDWAHASAFLNSHSPGKDRVNGVLQNMPEFQQAFSCSVGQPMVRRPACRVW